MYEDFVREKEKKEREAKKAERKKRMAAFRQVLDSTKSIKVRLARQVLGRCREVTEKPSCVLQMVILYKGDLCQADTSLMHAYMKSCVQTYGCALVPDGCVASQQCWSGAFFGLLHADMEI